MIVESRSAPSGKSMSRMISSPRSATRLGSRPSSAAIKSSNPLILPPPPTINTALGGVPPFSSLTVSAANFAIFSISGWQMAITSLAVIICSMPMMSSYTISSCCVAAVLIISAVPKSMRHVFARISVSESPACGIMPKAIIFPSAVIEISEVPAPISTIAIFSRRNFSGIATRIAAIGSNVRLATFKPASSTALYRPSTTSSGRNVAIMSAPIVRALWCSGCPIHRPFRK